MSDRKIRSKRSGNIPDHSEKKNPVLIKEEPLDDAQPQIAQEDDEDIQVLSHITNGGMMARFANVTEEPEEYEYAYEYEQNHMGSSTVGYQESSMRMVKQEVLDIVQPQLAHQRDLLMPKTEPVEDASLYRRALGYGNDNSSQQMSHLYKNTENLDPREQDNAWRAIESTFMPSDGNVLTGKKNFPCFVKEEPKSPERDAMEKKRVFDSIVWNWGSPKQSSWASKRIKEEEPDEEEEGSSAGPGPSNKKPKN